MKEAKLKDYTLYDYIYMKFFKKMEIELPTIPLLGIHTKETRIERHVYPNVHRSTVYNSQDMEAT